MLRNLAKSFKASKGSILKNKAVCYSLSTEQQKKAEEEKKKENVQNLIATILTKPDSPQNQQALQHIYDVIKATPEALPMILRLATKAGPGLLLQGYDVANSFKKDPVHVAITGAAGQIGYSLIPRIANGEMLGKDQPVILHLLERPEAMKALQGVVMELQDCAFPLVNGIIATSDVDEAFADADYTLLVGAKPRGPGMERADVLKDNAQIFAVQGQALDKVAKKTNLTLVVGNPANTNALIAASNAPSIAPENFSAMTRLDQDRAMAQLALKAKVTIPDIDKVVIWGNHSATQYPDISNATIQGRPAKEVINDQEWIENVFIPTVQNRGAAIIKARGLSSAASAADAAIKHMRDWALGSNTWVSMAVPSNGSYGVAPGVYCSFPVMCYGGGKYEIVQDIKMDDFSNTKFRASVKELFDERDAVSHLLKQ
eukprot:GEZU01035750.1.p1 GENE.GEZU01035750.1~~GEZU01035750.1.p1  ORF type:complete len:448 (+),score=188.69 GEZU01035750.1:56-1345(+)